MCQQTGPELCFNNLDDDCDGRIDCADSDCAPSVAQCVPLDPTGGKVGFIISTTASCPASYTDQLAVNQNLSGGGCAGCSCRAPTLSCSATISSFKTAADCQTASSAGTAEGSLSSTQACTTPDWVGSNFGTIYGVQAGAFATTLTPGTCTPSGTATPGAASWATAGRFCGAAMIGGGCAAGQACVPVNTASKCVMYDGAHACPAATTLTTWYTGASDTRTCGACTCGGPTGQSCAGMRITVGTDYTCSATTTLSSGQRYCYTGTGVYSPGLVFTGTATPPTCAGSATTSGALTATGQKTLCCM